MYTNVVFGTSKTVIYIEVSLFQNVLIEGFHCMITHSKFSLFLDTTEFRLVPVHFSPFACVPLGCGCPHFPLGVWLPSVYLLQVP